MVNSLKFRCLCHACDNTDYDGIQLKSARPKFTFQYTLHISCLCCLLILLCDRYAMHV